MRLDPKREIRHFFGHRAFEIHAGLYQPSEGFNITVLYVAAVFTQVQRNRIRPGRFRDQCRLYRIGVTRTPRLPQRRDVINIYAKFYHVSLFIVDCPAHTSIVSGAPCADNSVDDDSVIARRRCVSVLSDVFRMRRFVQVEGRASLLPRRRMSRHRLLSARPVLATAVTTSRQARLSKFTILIQSVSEGKSVAQEFASRGGRGSELPATPAME